VKNEVTAEINADSNTPATLREVAFFCLSASSPALA
jgi:hypothetical protein